MLEINGDIGKAREQKLRDRHKRRQEHEEAMIRKNVKRNQKEDGESHDESGGKNSPYRTFCKAMRASRNTRVERRMRTACGMAP